MEKTPKEIFLANLMDLVGKFEAGTGVEVLRISFNRVSHRDPCDMESKSFISSVEMDLK